MNLIEVLSEYDHPLLNRIVKNYRHLKKLYRKKDTDCFRIYDRDIPEYPFSADYYAGRFLIQYYDKSGGDEIPSVLKDEVERGLETAFCIKSDKIFWRVRKKRALLEQYEKLAEEKDLFSVRENGLGFYVNLSDYLDSGIFLDHRPLREYAGKISDGKTVLNLFSYTASISVYSAAGGAKRTVSVDMSNTYTGWAQSNFQLNKLDPKKNLLIREDCIKFLKEARQNKDSFDIIIIDPPTISRSKKMDGMFDINTGHASLIDDASKLLSSKESMIIFSTNSRKFRMDEELSGRYVAEDISHATIPEGFRDRKIHKVYTIKLK